MKYKNYIGFGILGGFSLASGLAAGHIIKKLMKYDSDGFDKEGFNRDGYDRLGFDRDGYNRAGYDASGFDRRGFDKQGFNHSGIDSEGYDREGYDKDGYNREGKDIEGFDRLGFGPDGFNRNGFDMEGFGRDKYNTEGIDRAGCNKGAYYAQLKRLSVRLQEAYTQLQYGDLRYSLHDVRSVMEELLILIVQHSGGKEKVGDRILLNLKTCQYQRLLDYKLINRLHSVRKLCNTSIHDIDAEQKINVKDVSFANRTVSDLLEDSYTALNLN